MQFSLVCSILLCKYITVHLSILLLMGLEAFTLVGWTSFKNILIHECKNFFRVYVYSEIAGFIYRPIINYNKYCQVILQSICSTLFHLSVYESYHYPTFLPILNVVSLILGILVSGLGYLIVVLICFSSDYLWRIVYHFSVYLLLFILPFLWIAFSYFLLIFQLGCLFLNSLWNYESEHESFVGHILWNYLLSSLS